MPSKDAPFEPVVLSVSLPPGLAGPDAVEFDVRCFVVPHADGVVLIDSGPPGSADAIGAALRLVHAGWDNVTDIVLTHAHFDHVGALAEVTGRSRNATVWIGSDDLAELQPPISAGFKVSALHDGDRVRGLRAISTPGHTPGHFSFLDEQNSVLFLGDLAGMRDGHLQRAPAVFTQDSARNDRSIGEAIRLGSRRIVPSHGEELTDPVHSLTLLLDQAT
jgi:glyoxylase-like metal-dependent hydrolase (beta-lactamase superfamily II)